MAKSAFLNLDENVAAAVSYVLGPFTGIPALVMEKENKFVRFHAMQSTITIGILMVINCIIDRKSTRLNSSH